MNKSIKNSFIIILSISIALFTYFYIYKNNIDNTQKNIIINKWWIIKWEEVNFNMIGEINKDNIKNVWKVEVIPFKKRNNLDNLR